MKGLFTILLVLVWSVGVQAALSLSPGGTVEVVEGESLEFYVVSSSSMPYEAYLCYYDAPVTPSGSPLPAAGPDAMIDCFEGCCYLVAMDLNPDPPNIEAGAHFEFTLTTSLGDAGNSYDIDLIDMDFVTVLDTLTIEVIEAECFDSAHPDYVTWIQAGNPECWCITTQCQGNADGIISGNSKSGYYHVGPGDVNLLIETWRIMEPPAGPGVGSIPNGICASVARDVECIKTACWHVGVSDLYIIVNNWMVREPPFGPGLPPVDCGGSIEPQIAPTIPSLSFTAETVDVHPGGTAQVSVDTTSEFLYIAYLGSPEAVDGMGATSFSASITSNACWGWNTLDPYGYTGYYEIAAYDNNPDDPCTIIADIHFILTVGDADLLPGQSYDIHIYADDWETIIDTVTVNIVEDCLTPETAVHPGTHYTDPGFNYYDEWVSVGFPSCWCYPSQCHGDGDGQLSGNEKTGYYRVGPPDLSLLLDGWKIKEPPDGPGLTILNPEICADFDHHAHGSAKTGYYRIGPPDLSILLHNWKIKEEPDGPGIPQDCGGSLE
ncbi:MAG: hypothetical protein JW860_16275 [Sedimentisphaerales bacterium]|nr:hypothetical protein [Sedimentisphaerales bacterium]